jgi:nucleotidyltransferase/DNA polymerase involved in DNA repair
MKTAVKLCPDLKIAPWNRPRISECSKQVMAILSEYGPLEQMSVDEAYIDLSEHLAPVGLSDTIRKRVKAETGLPASVGLATSKLVAKVASDHQKPEGCTIVMPRTEAKFLAPLSVRVIWGIGPRTAERLGVLGIETCGQLAKAELATMTAEFGNQAESLIKRARGIDERQVVTDRGPSKSISSEWTFNEDVNDPAILQARLASMVEDVGKSVRKQNLVAHTVTVKFRLANFTTYTRQKSVNAGISTDEDILHLATQIWLEHWERGAKLRLLGVGVSNLAEPAVQQLTFSF